MKFVLDQIKANKTGFSIQPIRFNNDVHLSMTYQNKKKDFQAIISDKDGGYIGFQKNWNW